MYFYQQHYGTPANYALFLKCFGHGLFVNSPRDKNHLFMFLVSNEGNHEEKFSFLTNSRFPDRFSWDSDEVHGTKAIVSD